MNKVRKPSNIVLDWKILISAFVYFLTAIADVSFPEGELGIGLCLRPTVRFFQYFLISLISHVLSHLLTCIQEYMYTNFAMQDTKICFTGGE